MLYLTYNFEAKVSIVVVDHLARKNVREILINVLESGQRHGGCSCQDSHSWNTECGVSVLWCCGVVVLRCCGDVVLR